MLTTACSLVVGYRVRVKVRIRFSLWLLSGYAHAFIADYFPVPLSNIEALRCGHMTTIYRVVFVSNI